MVARKKNIGVALSGSGFLFPIHVGALKAIVDTGYTITEIAGTSGGAIIASLYATGMTLSYMESITLNQDWSKMMSPRWWGWWNGICDGNPILEWIDAQTENKTFSETDIPLSVMTTNLTTGLGQMFSTRTTPHVPVALGARASSSIPFVYPPANIEGSLFVDGGVNNNIPVDKLTASKKIGIEIESDTSIIPNDASWLTIGERLIGIMLSTNEGSRVAWARQQGAAIIGVDRKGYSALERNMNPLDRKTLFQRGYDATKEALNDL